MRQQRKNELAAGELKDRLEGTTLVTTIKNNNTMPLVVPWAVLRKAGLTSGDRVEFLASPGAIIILPAATKRKRMMDADTLTADEAKKVRRGEKQIKEGHFKLWSDVKHEPGH